ncbi:MAG: DUF1707 domain-containing protein [Streptosporangiaceae bacterium]|jgi:hypothetical protein
MAAGPGYGMERPDYGHMRSSQADRERAVDVLKAAFAEGRLTQEEYTERVGQVYASRTYAELAALTADLPTGPLGTLVPAPPPHPSMPGWPPPPRLPGPPRARRSVPIVPVLMFAWLAAAMAGSGAAVAILPLAVVAVVVLSLLRSR